jgi:hypothetical protein
MLASELRDHEIGALSNLSLQLGGHELCEFSGARISDSWPLGSLRKQSKEVSAIVRNCEEQR